MRLILFQSLAAHPMLGKVYARLTPAELSACFSFLIYHDQLNGGDFERAINRMFVDRTKPQHYTHMLELLACANSLSRNRKCEK